MQTDGLERFSGRRFVGSLLDSQIARPDHEAGRNALPRVQADQQAGPGWFMESLHDSSIAHWGHERRLLARSPGFSRPDVLPPEGGTPCTSRFLESRRAGYCAGLTSL